MKVRWIFSFLMAFLLTSNIALAGSPYCSINVFYNDKQINDAAKPILKIGEPFKVRINLTVYQKSDFYVSLSCMEKESFEIISGPTLKIGKYSDGDILEANSSKEYEWTVKPTERWADGSLPLDIYYTILAHGNPKPLVNSGFTVAYPYISNEHYKGEILAPKDKTVPEIETTSTSKTASMPAFSLVTAIAVLAFVFFRFSRH